MTRIDIDKPQFDQSSFIGRLKHFANITDFRTVTSSTDSLNKSKELLELYKKNLEPPGTTEADIWRAKKLYSSAFHPDSGELQNVIGRMSFQVPGGMILTAGMLQFYRSTGAVIFWQWLNQSFNALVNYTNRNAASDVTSKQIAIAYVSATTCALVTALGFKNIMAKRARPLMQRFVPFLAVAAANLVNIPLSRQAELINGVQLFNALNEKVTESRVAAVKGIGLVAISRISMAAPGMLIMPLIMENLEKRKSFMKFSKFHLGFQTFMIGCFLVFMVPVACAMFPQQSKISLETLKSFEKEKYEKAIQFYAAKKASMDTYLYFNKGL